MPERRDPPHARDADDEGPGARGVKRAGYEPPGERAARGGSPVAGEPRTFHGRSTVGRPTPPFEVVGVDALSPLLDRVDFPATREDVEARIGSHRVPVTRERARSVRHILRHEGLPDAFPSAAHLERAVKAHWDEIVRADSADVGPRGSRHAPGDDLADRPHRG